MYFNYYNTFVYNTLSIKKTGGEFADFDSIPDYEYYI